MAIPLELTVLPVVVADVATTLAMLLPNPTNKVVPDMAAIG
jgi:hypothetical protein